MIRVLLVHDVGLLRSALAQRLAVETDFEVAHTPWSTAPSRARSLGPDVCAVDLECTESYGIAPLGELCDRRLLVIAAAHRPGPLRRAVEAQALGFVDRDGTPEQLVQGIRQVARGKRFVTDSLGFGFLRAAEMPLTRRELSVLSLAAGGASISDIAHSLHLSNGTVRNYMAAITRKTGARNRVDAIRISRGEGWL
ncbi:response regulator transcription factor [Streptomyces sp. NPDC001941]|uniref:response regulator transcription factor n=1 Tax=Streptomyces sp. NPDC001941 TaxID=3154659 RepID=UPI00333497F7